MIRFNDVLDAESNSGSQEHLGQESSVEVPLVRVPKMAGASRSCRVPPCSSSRSIPAQQHSRFALHIHSMYRLWKYTVLQRFPAWRSRYPKCNGGRTWLTQRAIPSALILHHPACPMLHRHSKGVSTALLSDMFPRRYLCTL